MNTSILATGILLLLAGLVGVVYGAGIILPGIIIIEWLLVLIAGLVVIVVGARRK